MRQKLANNYDAAIDLFDYCHQLDPESGAVLYELAELYRYAKTETLAIKALSQQLLVQESSRHALSRQSPQR